MAILFFFFHKIKGTYLNNMEWYNIEKNWRLNKILFLLLDTQVV